MTPWGSEQAFEAAPARASAGGLSAFMNRIYLTMSAGLVATGATAMVVASSPAMLERVMSWMWPLIIVELLMVVALSAVAKRLGAGPATALFLAYSVLNGLTLSVIFVIFTRESIASTFFISAAAFGATSAYGYFTKRDLSGVGSFMFMGLIGLVIASVVNIFLKSSALAWITSCVGVVVFTGLTAWDTQKMKRLYFESRGRSLAALAVVGALELYLDFVNLFLHLLRLIGRRR